MAASMWRRSYRDLIIHAITNADGINAASNTTIRIICLP